MGGAVSGRFFGEVDAAFEPVREAFAENFSAGRETGAALCVYVDGRCVVDLWGGVADSASGRPWERDTLQLVFSTTKGATALCAQLLAARGILDLDAPVASVWPEFAEAGKEGVTVRHLLRHEAGLAWVDRPLSLDEVLAWDPVVRALESQRPAWQPGTRHGYHAVTFGHLVGEVVRRLDGRSLGRFFAEEVAAPLGLDFWIGLPASEHHRVALLESPEVPFDDPAVAAVVEQVLGPDTPLGKALFMGGAFGAGRFDTFNLPEVWSAEIPAANGICDARSLAKMYAACVSEVDGLRLLDDGHVDEIVSDRTEGPDAVLFEMDMQHAGGFMVPTGFVKLGGPRSFGHYGAGGSVGFADPDARVGFGYVMNRMFVGLTGDPRTQTLIDAVYECL
ncbi:MAG: esterase [Acidimicrobiales bacterium]|nr:MAG: esterase [Acidimicrobiales bacterium]